jgi:hypothetical protein
MSLSLALFNDSVYEALNGDSLAAVKSEIQRLKSEGVSSSNNAYLGALLMKSAGLEKKPAQKISLFKEGHLLLEEEILAYPKNIEYRFLRLVIQEHAPKIVKYDSDIEEDARLIIEKYAHLPQGLKKEIKAYALQSQVLKSSKLIK